MVFLKSTSRKKGSKSFYLQIHFRMPFHVLKHNIKKKAMSVKDSHTPKELHGNFLALK